MSLLTLPDELILAICGYLDTFSVIELSETCVKFQLFFRKNSGCRKAIFSPSYGQGVTFSSILNFLRQNSSFITHLDFSYVHWYYRSELVRAVLMLKNLEYINLIGSSLTTSFLFTKREARRIKSFSFSLVPRDGLYLLYDMLHVNIVNHFHKPIKEMGADVEKLVTEIVLKAVCMDPSILRNICVLPKNIPVVSIKLKYSFPYELRDFAHPSLTDSLISKFLNDIYENDFFIIETLFGIFVSNKLILEFLDVPSLIDVKPLSNLGNERIVNIHMFYVGEEIKVQDIVERAKKIIERRSTKSISLYGPKHCPETGFDIEQYLSQLNDITHLTVQPCCLSERAEAADTQAHLIKKARVSKIANSSQNKTLLKNIAETHKNIEVLQIKFLGKCHECSILKMTCHEWKINISYLDSISEFKNLKYLCISSISLSTNLFAKIFEGCTLLESLYIRNRHNDTTVIESLPKVLHLAKNLKILELKIYIRDINLFIKLFPPCQSLLVLNLIIYTNVLAKEKLVTMESINTIIQMCPNITYLGIVEVNMDLTISNKRKLKLIEKKVSYTKYRILVNLTVHKDYMLYSLNDLGEFI